MATYITLLGSVTSTVVPGKYPHLIQIGTVAADSEPSTDTDTEPITARPTVFDRAHGSCVEPITENYI